MQTRIASEVDQSTHPVFQEKVILVVALFCYVLLLFQLLCFRFHLQFPETGLLVIIGQSHGVELANGSVALAETHQTQAKLEHYSS